MNPHPPLHERLFGAEVNRPADAPFENAAELEPEHKTIRLLIWVFFWLLLIEGILRKWLLPGLSTPLLLVRDPVVLLIYATALTRGIFPFHPCLIAAIPLFLVAGLTAMASGHGNPYVTLYGLRCSYMYLPLVFIIPKVFTLRDVEKIGMWLFLSALPMAVLVVLQFKASPNAWVNVGVAAAEGSQLEVGFGKIRPPGVFSFTSGLAVYLSLVSAFIFAWLIKKGAIPAKIAYATVPALGIMIGVSGSRGLLSAVVIILVGMVYVCLRNPDFFGKGVRAAFLIIVVFFGLQFRHEFRQGMIIFNDRIAGGGGVRDGLIYRTMSGFIEPLEAVKDTPLFGKGIGLGTTVAGGILYGERQFLLAEGEWTRIIKESGPLVGFAFLALRGVIVVLMFSAGSRAIADKNPLPMLLACSAFPNVLSGQWGVSSLLGFACFGAGLALAAARQPAVTPPRKPFQISPDSVTHPGRTVRGQSIYAAKLHGR